jgi:hypothetical protein
VVSVSVLTTSACARLGRPAAATASSTLLQAAHAVTTSHSQLLELRLIDRCN